MGAHGRVCFKTSTDYHGQRKWRWAWWARANITGPGDRSVINRRWERGGSRGFSTYPLTTELSVLCCPRHLSPLFFPRGGRKRRPVVRMASVLSAYLFSGCGVGASCWVWASCSALPERVKAEGRNICPKLPDGNSYNSGGLEIGSPPLTDLYTEAEESGKGSPLWAQRKPGNQA